MLPGGVGGRAGRELAPGVFSPRIAVLLSDEGGASGFPPRTASDVLLQALGSPSLSLPPGRELEAQEQLKAVLARAVGGDVWAAGILIAWVSRC